MDASQFSRLEALIGSASLEKLKKSRILLVGVGAVGGHAAEALVRSGVGFMRIVDFDTVEESNINRQIIALHSTVGRKKVEVAKERFLDINPAITIEAVDSFADGTNIAALTEGVDLVLDCMDSVTSKVSLIEECQRKKLWVISSMGAALRRDLSKIEVSTLGKTHGCPLAKAVRTAARKKGLSLDVPVVFSPEEVVFDYSGKENGNIEPGRKRISLGSLPTVTATFGEFMAHQALLHILGDDLYKLG